MAQRYEKRGVKDMGNSNNPILFIEEELITKESNPPGIVRRYINAK